MEINIGLICSCTTSFKQLFSHVKSKINQHSLRAFRGLVPGGPPGHTTVHGSDSIIEMGRYRSVETSDTIRAAPLPGILGSVEETKDVDLPQSR